MSNGRSSEDPFTVSGASDTATLGAISRSRQVNIVVAMYVGYAMFMVLRMAPTVASSAIIANPNLGIDLEAWGKIISAGTVGAVIGKFIGGFAADNLGGRLTFTVGLIVSALGVAAFAAASSFGMFAAAFFVALLAKSAGWPSMAKIIVETFRPAEYGRVWGILATSSRVGTLIATLCLGALLSWFSWQAMLFAAVGLSLVVAVYFFFAIGNTSGPAVTALSSSDSPKTDSSPVLAAPHPLDGKSLSHAIGVFVSSLQFWLIVGSLMGLSIMWDFLLMVPPYLTDTMGLEADKSAMASSAFPFGSLISVLVGGFVFDKLSRKATAWLMGFLLLVAASCILVFYLMPGLGLSAGATLTTSLGLLFVFGLCVAPCYYIPMSVFSIEFGGPHSGFLIALLDALAFGATAAYYYFAGGWAARSWSLFLLILLGVAVWAMLTTFAFMLGEARKSEQTVG